MLIVIFATSGALEAFATARTADSVRALLNLAPEKATRIRPDSGEETVHTADLEVGDLVRVRPGERIGADAVVVDGASEVDQASITGEPLPVANVGCHGVLVKSAVVMERLGDTNVVAFDKTGTLTEGTPASPRSTPLTGSPTTSCCA